MRSSQALLHGILDNSPVPIYMKDRNGSYVFVNRAFEDSLQISRAEILGHSDSHLFPADLARAFRANDKYAIAKQTPIQREELGVFNGEIRTYSSIKFPVVAAEGEILGVCGISTDITERVRAEDARREEREHIASDIHDDSVQVMTSVLLRMEAFESTLKEAEQRKKLAELKGAMRGSIDRLRRLMFDLKTELPEGGFIPALRKTLERIHRDHFIEFYLSGKLDPSPSIGLASVLFRVAREALMNIVKHANATHIVVELKRINDGVEMCVRDDGCGFREAPEGDKWHHGLTSMRTAIENAGGLWELNTGTGHGTEIRVRLAEPLRKSRG